MSIAQRHAPLISPEEFLAGEELSDVKHEYLNGVVHAMAGGKGRHSLLGVNLVVALHAGLRGKKCRAYNSDMLVRVQRGDDLRLYYPDAMIICRQAPLEQHYQEEPAVIFEVLSPSTARTDQGEKRAAYLTIPTLEAYVLVDGEQRAVTVWRRISGRFTSEYYTELEETIHFESGDCDLRLADIYEASEL